MICNIVWCKFPLFFSVCQSSVLLPCCKYTVKPVLRGHFWDDEKVVFQDRWPLKRGLIHMKISMTEQEKSEVLIEVTA